MAPKARRRRRAAALAAALAAPLAALPPAAPGAAQEAGPPALTLSFGQRLEASDNPRLAADPSGGSLVSVTSLGFSIDSATRRDSLSLDGALDLRAEAGADDGRAATGPRLALSYGREGANAAFGLDAAYRQDDIAFLRPLDALIPDGATPDEVEAILDGLDGDGDGIIDLPDLRGEGTRRDLSLGTRLALGEEGPLGLTLRGQARLTSYDESAADLRDVARLRVSASARAALRPGIDATATGSYTIVDEDGGERTATPGLDLGLAFDPAFGGLDVGIGVTPTDAGTRLSLRLGRGFEQRDRRLAFSLGLTRTAEGDLALTGSATAARDFDDGRVSAALRRSVATDADGEVIVTTLSAGWDRAVSRRLSLGLDAALVATERTATGEDSRAGDVAARLDWAVTEDWSLGTGLRHSIRDGSDGDAASETALFVTLGRSLQIRF